MNRWVMTAITRLQTWAEGVLREVKEDLRTPGGKMAVAAGGFLALGLGSALASNPIDTLTASASQWMCSLAQFAMGPLSWGAIGIAAAFAIASLAFGGRGAIRLLILSLAAAVGLLILKAYFSSNAGNFRSCL